MDWDTALELAKKDQHKFIERGRRIVKRYRDERGTSTDDNGVDHKYNILWSNVRTLFPAVYAKKPKAQVERRYKDQDPVARTASQILERALQYEIDHYSDYDEALKGAVLDRLLPGRGVAWVRFEGGSQITDDVSEDEDDKDDGAQSGALDVAAPAPVPMAPGGLATPPPLDPKDYECTPADYVFWEDFRCSPARTWEEVTWVARRVYMGKAEGEKRFGAKFAQAPLKHEPIGLEDDKNLQDMDKKAIVWEIWDKPTKRVLWVAEGLKDDLDSKDDPLELDGFWPCPKPLFATTTTDTLIPVADYAEYQDQANELDELTQRIYMLVKAVKVVGVYDASQTGVQRMLQEGCENTLIPVDNWAVFASAGGTKGVMEFMPLDMVVKALQQLYVARDACKQVIYEVTGLSDIIRGASVASETATAQQIKSQYASLRLKETQTDVARFATDILNIKAQIMCALYRPETLKAMSGIDLTEDKQYADEAIKLLKSDTLRNYRIDIATDSMVEMDEQAEKESRVEFLTAAGGFLEKAVQAIQVQPELAPLMGEMLMFGVRAFKAGRPLEAAFEQFLQKMSQPQQPKTDPEAAKAQAAQQEAQVKAQSDMQIAQINAQATMQVEQAKAQAQLEVDRNRQAMEAQQHQAKIDAEAQLEALKFQYEDARHQREMEFQRWKAELEAATKIEAANIASKAKVADAATDTATKEIAAEVQQ